MDYKKEFKKIQSNAEYIIDELKSINSALLPSAKQDTLCLDIMEKIDYLKNDYRLVVDKIDDILYSDDL